MAVKTWPMIGQVLSLAIKIPGACAIRACHALVLDSNCQLTLGPLKPSVSNHAIPLAGPCASLQMQPSTAEPHEKNGISISHQPDHLLEW